MHPLERQLIEDLALRHGEDDLSCPDLDSEDEPVQHKQSRNQEKVDSQSMKRELAKCEDKLGRAELHEAEKTKKKKKRIREDLLRTDILEKTPKIERKFSFANFCFSPLLFSSMKKEDKEDKEDRVAPSVLQETVQVISPSKMLSLSSPMHTGNGFFQG